MLFRSKISMKTRTNTLDLSIEKMKSIIDRMAAIELRRRKMLPSNNKAISIICRSWGIITNSPELSEEESLRQMSWGVAGINAGIKSSTDVNDIKKAIVQAMGGHLLINGGDVLCEQKIRAHYLMKALAGKDGVTIG